MFLLLCAALHVCTPCHSLNAWEAMYRLNADMHLRAVHKDGHIELSIAFVAQQSVGERMSLAAKHCAAIHYHCICSMQHFLALAVLL